MTAGPEAVRPDLLRTIVAATRRIVEVRQEREPLSALARRAEAHLRNPGSLVTALGRYDRYNIVAECKRRSPSRGVLRPEYDPVAIARGYARGGAAALSVLTEPTFFDGSLDHLVAVRAAVDLPLLRKDFIISEYQLMETRATGADAVLLIVAALTPSELKTLVATATSLGLDALVEVHDGPELAVAIDAGATLVGVNNRDLRTLSVDVGASETLIAQIPTEVAAVSESGLRSAEDLVRLRDLGYRGFLIGETFMMAPDPGGQLKLLLAAADRIGAPDVPRQAHDSRPTLVTEDKNRGTGSPTRTRCS